MSFDTILTAERIERNTRAGHWVERTITDYLDHNTDKTSDKVASVDCRRQVTFAELHHAARGLLELIVRGGENSPVAYVENVLYEHPDIDKVALVAVPDPRLQEASCACIVLKDGATKLTLESMKTFLADKGVAKQYWPEKLVLLDAFPTSPSGKIQKLQLRDQVGRDT